MTVNAPTIIVGGGLAGCEAAWQLSRRGLGALLYDMKPQRFSPAHQSPLLAELVCSNSLRAKTRENAAGLLKEEMRRLDSLIMEAADATAVPAGRALAVNRTDFSKYIENLLASTSDVQIIRRELAEIPGDRRVIIATGPLTSDSLAGDIARLTGAEHLYFYDAISPIIDAESIDYEKVFRASRYDSGEGDYLNCPFEKEDYERFWKILTEGEDVPLRSFEAAKCFESCLPVEVIARRGIRTLAFGPMKPVGLIDPRTGRRPYAVVQLRPENRAMTLFNMVGFQTKLTWPEQQRIFRMIPGLEHAEFARYGSIHRNTFIHSPALLNHALQLRADARILFAGQITGVEGYVESAAMGLLAGLNAAALATGKEILPPPETTAIGSLLHHIINAKSESFQPMNINFGLFPPLEQKTVKKDRGRAYADRALADLMTWKAAFNI
ncbi:MAG: methylenetetrahydrofolate--tRNA-(uracil(54)-C(5))-methyltransferase (FADH(2)-oxidizing) TrmFO [Pseudomonadota bacterium]